MKSRITVSIEEETICLIRDLIRTENTFRNKSHVVEYALQELKKRRK